MPNQFTDVPGPSLDDFETYKTLKTYQYYGNNIILDRVGCTVFCTCIGSNYNSASANSYLRDADNNVLPVIPTGYRPTHIVDVKDNLASKRLQLAKDSSGWRFITTEALSSAVLRFSCCWVTEDDYPT